MAAKSKHYGDVLMWLEKVLYSCKTKEQIDNTRKLFVQTGLMYSLKSMNTNNELCELFKKSVILRDEICKKDLQIKINNLNKTQQNR